MPQLMGHKLTYKLLQTRKCQSECKHFRVGLKHLVVLRHHKLQCWSGSPQRNTMYGPRIPSSGMLSRRNPEDAGDMFSETSVLTRATRYRV
jgi:hypothetical protein